MAEKTNVTASPLPTDAPLTSEELTQLLFGDPDEQVSRLFDETGVNPRFYNNPLKGQTSLASDAEDYCSLMALATDAPEDTRLRALDLLGRFASRYQHPIVSQNVAQALQEAARDASEPISERAITILGSLKRWGVYPVEPLVPLLFGLETAFTENDLPMGEEYFRQLRKLAPWNGWAHYAIGRLREEAERFVDAADALATAVRLRPGWSFALRRYARLLMSHLQQPQKAIDLLEKHLEQSPSDAEIMYTLGLAYEQVDRDAEALALYQQAVVITPEEARFWRGVSYHLTRMERFAEAAATERKIVALTPDDPHAWNRMGNLYSMAKQYEDSAQAYGYLYVNFPDFAPQDVYAQAGNELLSLLPAEPFAK